MSIAAACARVALPVGSRTPLSLPEITAHCMASDAQAKGWSEKHFRSSIAVVSITEAGLTYRYLPPTDGKADVLSITRQYCERGSYISHQ